MLLIAVVVTLSAGQVCEEQLLANPGFEELIVDRPARWDLFVQPPGPGANDGAGALGRTGDLAHSGKYSIMLHTPVPYAKKTFNNWSQALFAGLGGKQLHVSGWIRVEEAEEAAIWLQCWRKRPWRLLSVHSTSKATPIYGTRDWEEAAMTVDVPEDTDFLMLRCVLSGPGSAWFDDVAVAEVQPDEGEDEGDSQEEGSQDTATTPAPAQDVSLVEEELSRLRDANLVLAEALEQMQQDNQELMEGLLLLREQLRTLQQGLASGPSAELETGTAPPLVPHGVNWEEGR